MSALVILDKEFEKQPNSPVKALLIETWKNELNKTMQGTLEIQTIREKALMLMYSILRLREESGREEGEFSKEIKKPIAVVKQRLVEKGFEVPDDHRVLLRNHMQWLKMEHVLLVKDDEPDIINRRLKHYSRLKTLMTEIELSTDKNEFKRELKELKQMEQGIGILLSGLGTEEGRYVKSAKAQSEVRHLDTNGEFEHPLLVCRPSFKHQVRNEDAFRHSENITVVADGVGGGLFAEGASNYVVTNLHSMLEGVVEKFSRKEVNPKRVFTEIIDVCERLSQNLREVLFGGQTGPATTAAIEVRIPDNKGNVHRYVVCIGDSNVALIKNGSSSLLLNPIEYPNFDARNEQYTTVSKWKVPCLMLDQLKEVERRSYEASVVGRNVNNVKGYFCENPAHTFGNGHNPAVPQLKLPSIGAVYVRAHEVDTTIVMTDGLTDRCDAKEMRLDRIERTVSRINCNESMLDVFESSKEYTREEEHVVTLLKSIASGRYDSVSKREKKVIDKFRNDSVLGAKGCPGTKVVMSLIRDLGLPVTDGVNDIIRDVCRLGYSEQGINFDRAAQAVVIEMFELSKIGVSNIFKWHDDLTVVVTGIGPAESAETDRPHYPDIMNTLLFEITDDEGEASKIMQQLKWLSIEYESAKDLLFSKEKSVDIEDLKSHIRRCLKKLYVSNSAVWGVIVATCKKKESSDVKEFLHEVLGSGWVELQALESCREKSECEKVLGLIEKLHRKYMVELEPDQEEGDDVDCLELEDIDKYDDRDCSIKTDNLKRN